MVYSVSFRIYFVLFPGIVHKKNVPSYGINIFNYCTVTVLGVAPLVRVGVCERKGAWFEPRWGVHRMSRIPILRPLPNNSLIVDLINSVSWTDSEESDPRMPRYTKIF